MARITIFKKDGLPAGVDIRAATIREWILNADPSPGRCTFYLSRNDVHNSETYLQFGNYVLVREKNLPDWIGIIVNRQFGFGTVRIIAYQAEFVLDKRKTKITLVRGVAGTIFRKILEATNAEFLNEKPIRPDEIYTGGTTREETTGKTALYHIRQVAARAGNDFDITYNVTEGGKLFLLGNWYRRTGVTTEFTLREGHNVEVANSLLEEDARAMANGLEGRGDASTEGTRPTYYSIDEESIAQYGLWQDVETFAGNKERATVKNNTMNTLLATKNPFSSYDLNALNVGDTFQNLQIGNVLYLELLTAGYDTDTRVVRISGMEKSDLSGKVRLITEDYNGTDDFNAG